LADKAQGDQQYKDIDNAIDYDSEVGTLIKQLETYYDRVLSRPTEDPEGDSAPESGEEFGGGHDGGNGDVSLPRGVEDFLNQMGERFENSSEGGGEPPEDVADVDEDSEHEPGSTEDK
jgi:hypothetical protein